MNREASNSSAPRSFEIRSGKHHPLKTWSKNTQLRFQAKLYTYTPKSLHKVRKRQLLDLPAQTESEDGELVESQYFPKQVNQVGKQLKKGVQVYVESHQLEEEKKKDTEEENKNSGPEKKEEKIDIKDLTPLKTRKTRDSMLKRTCVKDRSESSEWTIERKPARKKKSKEIKKRGRKSKKQGRMKNEKIVIKLF